MRSVALAIIGLAISMPISTMAQPLPRTVLVIDQGTSNTPTAQAINRSFQSEIDALSGTSVYVYLESLGTAVFGDANYSDLLLNYFREKYRGRPIGVILARGTATLPYALRLRDELWPGTALVFAGVGDRAAAEWTLPPDVVGVTFHLRLQDMVDTARRLVPDLRKIAIVAGRPDSSWRGYEQDRADVAAEIEVIDLSNLPLAEIKERVASLPADAAIAYIGLTRDITGATYLSRNVLQSIAEVANRPIVVDLESTIGVGATGGLVMSNDGVGREAARLAWRILSGESTSSISSSNGNMTKWIFDARQLQRWGISESGLPAGSEIRFRSPTAWEQYQWQIILIAVALFAQSLLIAALLHQRRRRQQAEVETRQRVTELARMNRRAVASEMSATIAHEISQPLTAILSNAEAAYDLLGEKKLDRERIREIVSDIIEEDTRASDVIDRVRKLLRKGDSKSETVDLNGLVESALRLVHGELVKRKINIATALAADLPATAGDPVQLQQVLLNLLINAMDAVGSKTPPRRIINISTRANGKRVEVDITDSGHGIAADDHKRVFEPFFTTKDQGLGLGLSICLTIVKAHEGKLSIQNNDLGGATAVLTLPSARATDREIDKPDLAANSSQGERPAQTHREPA